METNLVSNMVCPAIKCRTYEKIYSVQLNVDSHILYKLRDWYYYFGFVPMSNNLVTVVQILDFYVMIVVVDQYHLMAVHQLVIMHQHTLVHCALIFGYVLIWMYNRSSLQQQKLIKLIKCWKTNWLIIHNYKAKQSTNQKW